MGLFKKFKRMKESVDDSTNELNETMGYLVKQIDEYDRLFEKMNKIITTCETTVELNAKISVLFAEYIVFDCESRPHIHPMQRALIYEASRIVSAHKQDQSLGFIYGNSRYGDPDI